ncbi:MAG: TldD/PmbA family protein [Promethearchaeota archaeon]|nr:MAG: TldD/PmbA family protein [Candidatus Lokiarchaeota archaeon]
MKKLENLDKLEQISLHIKKQINSYCDDWVIKGTSMNRNQIRFSESQIDTKKNWNEIGITIFMAKSRRTTEITLNDLRLPSIDSTLKYCEKLLESSQKNRYFKRLPEGPFNYKNHIKKNIFDEKVAVLGDDAVRLVENATEACLKEGANRVAGSFFYGIHSIFLETSEEIAGKYQKSELNFRIRAFAEDMYATGEGLTVSTHLSKGFDPIAAGQEAGEICRQAIGGKKGNPGTYNIIIYPKVSTEIQAPTAALAMNTYVKKMGLSWLVGKKKGDKVGNDNLTIWDDGTKDYGLGTAPYDDEGVPTKKTLLIDKGRINKFFTNTSLSRRSEDSTGNAGITIPEPTNIVFKPGDCSLKELMEISEKPTLLITSTWYTRYQSYAPPGIFSSLPKDGMFLIKQRGDLLEPIRELRINTDHFHMMDHLKALGKHNKQVSTWLSPANCPVFAPFMLIEDVVMSTGTK